MPEVDYSVSVSSNVVHAWRARGKRAYFLFMFKAGLFQFFFLAREAAFQ